MTFYPYLLLLLMFRLKSPEEESWRSAQEKIESVVTEGLCSVWLEGEEIMLSWDPYISPLQGTWPKLWSWFFPATQQIPFLELLLLHWLLFLIIHHHLQTLTRRFVSRKRRCVSLHRCMLRCRLAVVPVLWWKRWGSECFLFHLLQTECWSPWWLPHPH